LTIDYLLTEKASEGKAGNLRRIARGVKGAARADRGWRRAAQSRDWSNQIERSRLGVCASIFHSIFLATWMGTPSEEFSLILDLDFTRAAIESFDLAGHGSCRESGICVEAQRKDGVRDLLKRRIERLSLLSRYAQHPSPEPEAAFANENVGLQHSKVRFVEAWGYESRVTASIAQFKRGPHEEHAIGLTHRQRAGPGSEGLFVGFLVPGLPLICPMAANPYGMSVEVCWREISELLQLWHGGSLNS
jgi:hypothetical protein